MTLVQTTHLLSLAADPAEITVTSPTHANGLPDAALIDRRLLHP